MTKAQMVFKKAVKLAKTFTGDWIACMKLALKIIWAAVRKGASKVVEFVGSAKQIKWANEIYSKMEKAVSFIESKVSDAFKNDAMTSPRYEDLTEKFMAFYNQFMDEKQAHQLIEWFGYDNVEEIEKRMSYKVANDLMASDENSARLADMWNAANCIVNGKEIEFM